MAAITSLYLVLTNSCKPPFPDPKRCFMNFDQDIQEIKEMEGRISLLDNKKFVYSAGFIGLYYIAYITYLTCIVIQAGGFH